MNRRSVCRIASTTKISTGSCLRVTLPRRLFWDRYQKCYEDIFEQTSTKHAPWFVIPADEKWYRNVAISSILVDTLKDMKLKYPTSDKVDVSKSVEAIA